MEEGATGGRGSTGMERVEEIGMRAYDAMMVR